MRDVADARSEAVGGNRHVIAAAVFQHCNGAVKTALHEIRRERLLCHLQQLLDVSARHAEGKGDAVEIEVGIAAAPLYLLVFVVFAQPSCRDRQ